MIVYADTSALVKLVVNESHSNALDTWITTNSVRLMSSNLTRTEFFRAVRRRNLRNTENAYTLLDRVGIINLDHSVYDEAGIIPPIELRSLDAIHLTAARLLGRQLDGLLTYDDRLAEAAQSMGMRIYSPT